MPLLAALKTATTACHEALETRMDVFHRVRTVDEYRNLLRAFCAVYAPLENSLGDAFDWMELGWDFEGRRKTPLLVADLNVLAGKSSSAPLPPSVTVPPIFLLPEAVGALYVIEGSTLGGQMISRHFSEILGVTIDSGGRFFAGYGSQTGARWREFCQWAERMAVSGESDFEATAVRSARSTFETFDHVFATSV